MFALKLDKALAALALVLGIGEFASSIVIWRENYADSVPAFAVLFGVLFLLAAWLVYKAYVIAGAAFVGALCLFEVASFPSWTKHGVLDWSIAIVFVVVCVVEIGLAVAALVSRLASRRRGSAELVR
ncbi:MAG: hypothetical protein QOI06_2128 [Nocardioidaceae bacterium]|jgi:hypothetical protein|nr:hypothetical protein [Nocardioidaceae bacterium]